MDLKTKADLEYLLLVYQTSTAGIVDYKSVTCTDDQLKRFRRLCHKHYVDRAGNGRYKLTALGLQAANEAEELCEQAAEAEAKQRNEDAANAAKQSHDRKLHFCHDFKVAAFTVALTLTLERVWENADRILEFLKSLFH